MSRANGTGTFGSAMVGAGIRRTTFAVAVGAALLLLGALVTPSGAQTTASTAASTPAASPGDATCPTRPVRAANGSFEGPVATTGTAVSFETGTVQGWTSARKKLTLAASGYQDVTAATGRQFLVLSTSTSTAVHQDLPTTPSETLAWSLAHRTVSGTGTIRVRIGAPGEAGEVVATLTDGTTWTTHGDDYRVPDDQTITRFTIESTGGTAVDLIDDASFGSASCLVATSTVTPEGANDVGAVITETVTVRNVGGSPTTEATLATTVPTSLRYVTDSAIPTGVWNYLPDTLLVTLVGASGRPGVILPGEAVLATWRLDIGPEAADGTIRTQVAVTSSDALGGSRRTGTDSAVTPVRASADVQLSQSFAPALVAPGGPTTFSFAIRNDGPSTAHGVTAVAVIPDGVGIDPGAVPAGCRMVTRTITCVVGSLPDGDSRSWSVALTAPATNGVVKARLAVSATTPDPSLDNGTSTAMLSVGPPPGARLDIVTNPSPLLSTAGAITTIVADVTNTGSSPTTGPVTVTDLTPEPFVDLFLAAVVAEGPPATCAVATRSCTIEALAPGQSVRVEFRGTVRPETDDGTTIAGGVVASTPDGTAAAAELIIAVRAFANLTLDEITPTVPDVAAPVTRIVTVTNGGPSFAKATSVFIPVPTDAVVVTRPAECTLILGGLSCPLGDLPAGRPAQSVFAFQLPPTGTSISDRAGVNTATPTEWPVADYSPQRWTVAPAVKLSTTLSTLPTAITVGDRVDVVVTAANAGPGAATDVIVPLDPARNGLRVLDADTRTGQFDPTTSRWTIPALAAGEKATLRLGVQALRSGDVALASTILAVEPDLDSGGSTAITTMTVSDAEVVTASSGVSGWVWILLAAVLVAIAVVTVLVIRRRRSRRTGPPPPAS
jgi:hypothetical protein